MITFNFPLAVLAILFRRFLDSFHHNIPVSSTVISTPNTTSIVILSSAIYYLYKHLRRGTLLRVPSRDRSLISSDSNMSCRVCGSSWMLRNLRGNRSKYTVAIRQFANETMRDLEEQASDSMTEIDNIGIGKIHYLHPIPRQPIEKDTQAIRSLPLPTVKPTSIFGATQRQVLLLEDQQKEISIGDKKDLSQRSRSATNSPDLNVAKKSDLNVIDIIDLTRDDQDVVSSPGAGDLALRRKKKCGKRRRSSYLKRLRYHDK